jgi:hypothetical protein
MLPTNFYTNSLSPVSTDSPLQAAPVYWDNLLYVQLEERK